MGEDTLEFSYQRILLSKKENDEYKKVYNSKKEFLIEDQNFNKILVFDKGLNQFQEFDKKTLECKRKNIDVRRLINSIYSITYMDLDILEKIEDKNSYILYEIGRRYLMQGTSKIEQAREYFEKSSNLGNLNAKHEIAKMLYWGKFGQREYEKAYEIFQELGYENNYYEAKYYIGLMYFYGQYVQRDYKKAYEIFQELINEIDHYESKYYIGLMYYYGQYVETDYEKAYGIFEKLANEIRHLIVSIYFGEFIK